MEASEIFRRAGRMYPLLAYVVSAEIAGRGDTLCQPAIAVDVLGRDTAFDPQLDPIVRVEAGRLRAKLREYYATEGRCDDVEISLPKGGYRPTIALGGGPAPEPLPPQEIRYCRTPDDVALAYALMGKGMPIVRTSTWLTHLELEYESDIWHHYLFELSRGRRLVRYDSRNMGMSDRHARRFDFDSLVTDLETVVDAAGLERFAIFGTSQGVSVAVAYAARHPERVSHLILLGGFLRGPRLSEMPGARDFCQAIEASIRFGWQQPDSNFRTLLCRSLMPEGTPAQHAALDAMQGASCDLDAVIRYTEFVHRIDVRDEAPRVAAPTLVCHAHREMVPFGEAQIIASQIPGARLVPLESRNHLLQPDEPAWANFVGALNDFLCEA
jgi:pimeloyl-ACP methyl ester carboxylesterase